MARIRLCSYAPLASTAAGRKAAVLYRIAPFVDGSCRREPDLEAAFPSISALCRGGRFAPHLHEGDRIVYVTKNGTHSRGGRAERRLVACLLVIKRCETHKEAATWYRNRKLALPSNCVVAGNPPEHLNHTLTPTENPKIWEAVYRHRARRNGVFLICRTEALNLISPPRLTEARSRRIFGEEFPGTQQPKIINEKQFKQLLALLLRKREGA